MGSVPDLHLQPCVIPTVSTCLCRICVGYGGGMKAARPYSRHGLNAGMARVKLRGFRAIDRRTVAGREVMAFRREVASALGGEEHLSLQRCKLVDMAARAALFRDGRPVRLAAPSSTPSSSKAISVPLKPARYPPTPSTRIPRRTATLLTPA